jgi:thiamine pyrophosphokinase
VKALIVADGDVSAQLTRAEALLQGEPDARPLVLAADGGAHKAELLGLRPDVVVGDLDSLSPASVERLRGQGVEVQQHPRAKEESDTELAVREALRRGARQLVILGGLGGLRLEHSLANVLLLTLPELAGCDVTMVDGPSVVRVIGGRGADRLELEGEEGDLVSLLALSERVEGVTTTGLAYPLDDEALLQGPSRGLSNVMQASNASVQTRGGRLAVIHTRFQTKEARDA